MSDTTWLSAGGIRPPENFTTTACSRENSFSVQVLGEEVSDFSLLSSIARFIHDTSVHWLYLNIITICCNGLIGAGVHTEYLRRYRDIFPFSILKGKTRKLWKC